MSAAPAAAATDTVAPKAGGKRKLIILIAAVLLLVLAGGGGALYYLKAKAAAEAAEDEDAAYAEEDGDADAHAERAPRKKRKKSDDHAVPVFVPLEPFVVNLADHDTDRYAQIGVTLQVDDAKVGDEIAAYMPAVRNNILLLLSRKTAQDLAGADGKETLADEVRREAVRAMGFDVELPQGKKRQRDPSEDWPIAAVQFSSFIIQ